LLFAVLVSFSVIAAAATLTVALILFAWLVIKIRNNREKQEKILSPGRDQQAGTEMPGRRLLRL
jgi:hypothetical protein